MSQIQAESCESSNLPRSWRDRRGACATLFVIAVFYALASAAAFHGFYGKWQMMDGIAGQSLPEMLDGEANRPFVYRQLLPSAANLIDEMIGPQYDRYLEERLVDAEGNLMLEGGADAVRPGYIVRYRLVYYATFLCFFAALFAIREVLLQFRYEHGAATITPVLFALLLPVFLTRGGYFYDLPEVLFFMAAAALAARGRFLLLLALCVPATLNKESFFFYVLTLAPLLAIRWRIRAAVAMTGALVLVSGLTYLVVRTLYADNPGTAANFQLLHTLGFYLNPLNLLQMEQSYGVPLFKGYGVITFALIGLIAVGGWPTTPQALRRHMRLAVIVNLPLFLLFCAEGEMRNLSMLYPSLSALLAGALQRWWPIDTRTAGR